MLYRSPRASLLLSVQTLADIDVR